MSNSDIRKRSWDLVRGNRGKVFLIIAIFFVMNLMLAGGSNWVTSTILDSTSGLRAVIQSLLGNLISIFISPLQTISITLLYYDIRIRKEGFDLEMLSQAMVGGPAVNA